MNQIVADEVQQSQVVQLPVLVIAVCMVDVDFIVHRDEKPAIRAPSALVLQEFPSGCIQSDVLPPSRAPVTPVAIIWACVPFERRVSFDVGVPVFPKHFGLPCESPRVVYPLVVSIEDPPAAFLGVFPLCPAEHLVPQHFIYFAEDSLAHLSFVIIAPPNYLWVDCSYYIVKGCGLHPFYDRCQFLVVPQYAAFTRLYDGLV